MKKNKISNLNISKPKAFFIDIDGTLVKNSSHLNLNLDDKLSIKRALKNKIYIILSTGRSIDNLIKIWKQFDDGSEYSRYAITNNGSGIWDLKEKKMISENWLDKKDFNNVFNYVKEKGYAIKNSKEPVFYVKKGLLSLVVKLNKTTTVSDDFTKNIYNNESAKKLGIITTFRKKKVAKISNEIQEKFKNVEVSVSGGGLYIEVNKNNVNKGSAIKFLAKHLNINIKETSHIGDSMNDLSAFKVVGISVAMKNGMKELKKYADFITNKQKKSGVSEVLKSFGNT